jgi:hypothetical protein
MFIIYEGKRSIIIRPSLKLPTMNRNALVLMLNLAVALIIWNNYFLTNNLEKEILSQLYMVTPNIINKSIAINLTTPIRLDLVIMLSGELGNYMLKIAYGKIVQTVAQEDGRFNFTLRFMSPGLPKNLKAGSEIKKCFSKHFSAKEINMDEFRLKSPKWKEINVTQSKVIESLYTDWNDKSLASKKLQIIGSTVDNIRSTLDHLDDVINRMKKTEKHKKSLQLLQNRYNLSLPFITLQKFPPVSLMDRYWDVLAETFTFNQGACCEDTPLRNETVLHVRGFDVEKPDSYEKKGWRELNANRIYDELLYNLNSGDKVAIVGRFPEKVANFTSTLLGHGLEVRSITNHSGVQDFCFLKSATKEIIGGVKSTFFRIAALLNDSVSKVTIYCLHQPSQLDCKHHYASTFTHEKQTRKEWNFPIIY